MSEKRKVEIVVELETADLGESDDAWDAWSWTVERQLEDLASISSASVVGFSFRDAKR